MPHDHSRLTVQTFQVVCQLLEFIASVAHFKRFCHHFSKWAKRRYHALSFGNNAEKDRAGCRTSNHKYIVIEDDSPCQNDIRKNSRNRPLLSALQVLLLQQSSKSTTHPSIPLLMAQRTSMGRGFDLYRRLP